MTDPEQKRFRDATGTRSPKETDRPRRRRRRRLQLSPPSSPPPPSGRHHKDRDNTSNSGVDEKQEEENSGEEMELMDEDEMETMKKLRIPTRFDSSKGKPVPGNDVGAVRKASKRQGRQYMNRRGGFNRPMPSEVTRRQRRSYSIRTPGLGPGSGRNFCTAKS